MLKPVQQLKVRITGSLEIPDPTEITTAGSWYYLDHISSGIVGFSADKGTFVPVLGTKWRSLPDGTHVFPIRQDAKFHDGTPLAVKDVIWSIKRQLIKKTATHFRFWEYIKGCEKIKFLNDECEGIYEYSDHEVGIRLYEHADSFFLQLASPETGVYWAGDMDPRTLSLNPTKFSGPYYVHAITDDAAILKRNEFSPISDQFPNSPKEIDLVKLPLSKVDEALKSGQIDLTIRSYRPLGEVDWKSFNIEVQETTNSNLIYMSGTGDRPDRKEVSAEFLTKLWKRNKDQKINPAATFLPFGGGSALTQAELLAELSPRTSPQIRVLCPEGFFAPAFLDQIKAAAADVGSNLEISFLPGPVWAASFGDPKVRETYDFILTSYAASERYPTVQLGYLTGSLVKSPIDLKKAESPTMAQGQNEILRDYEKWLLKIRQVVPLFFNRTLFIYRKGLDLGAQSQTDAEIELWRIQEVIK